MVRKLSKLRVHPLFLVMLILAGIMGDFIIVIKFLIVVFLHEYAHAFVAKKLGYALNKCVLMPYGVGLSLCQNFTSPDDEVKIAVAGPLFNFCCAFLLIAFWWIFPSTFSLTNDFVFINIIVGVFNLLPAYPLDGGRVLTAIISKKKSRIFAIKVTTIFNVVLSFALVISFIITLFFGQTNLSLAVMSIFLFVGIFDGKWSCKYGFVPFLPKNISLEKGISVKTHAFASRTQIYKVVASMSSNKYNVFYIVFDNGELKAIGEKQLEKLALNYPPTMTLGEVFRAKLLK